MKDSTLPYVVLYIEDDIQTNKRVASRLQRYFQDVHNVTTAEDGYETYLNIKPDIMFIDINLPKMSGMEFLEKIRETDQQTKAVILTARSDTQILLQAASLKVSKYLIKPLSRNDLEDTVQILEHEIKSFQVISKEMVYFKNNFCWNKKLNILYQNNEQVTLTHLENKVFQYFVEHTNYVLSYDDITTYVWEDVYEDKKSSLKTIIKNLRKKIPENLIQNEFGFGYKMVY